MNSLYIPRQTLYAGVGNLEPFVVQTREEGAEHKILLSRNEFNAYKEILTGLGHNNHIAGNGVRILYDVHGAARLSGVLPQGAGRIYIDDYPLSVGVSVHDPIQLAEAVMEARGNQEASISAQAAGELALALAVLKVDAVETVAA